MTITLLASPDDDPREVAQKIVKALSDYLDKHGPPQLGRGR